MLVADASVLYEVLTAGPHAGAARRRLALEHDQRAPDVIDAEGLGLLRRDALGRAGGETTCALAVRDPADWPERADRPVRSRS